MGEDLRIRTHDGYVEARYLGTYSFESYKKRMDASVHGCLTIVDDERYVDLERLEPYDQDGYVMFAGRPDAWYVLDLGWIRDGTGDPTVLAHDPNDGLILSSRERLRPFLDQFLYDVLDADS